MLYETTASKLLISHAEIWTCLRDKSSHKNLLLYSNWVMLNMLMGMEKADS